MNFNSTVKGSALEGFYPAGWDMENGNWSNLQKLKYGDTTGNYYNPETGVLDPGKIAGKNFFSIIVFL